MLRCIKVKRSVLPMRIVLNCDIRQFHVTPKTYVRKAVRKYTSNEVEPEDFKIDFNSSLRTQDPNINFLGIESDVGVITLGSPQNKSVESTIKKNFKEKFHQESFGIVRYDADNKLKFHGQYKNKRFLFPRQNMEYAEVSKITNGSLNHSKSLSNIKDTNKDCESYSHEQSESYIDKHYFNNISETDNIHYNNNSIETSSEELSFVDKNYFETLTASENCVSEKANATHSDIQTSPELNFAAGSNYETGKNSENFISGEEKNEIFGEREYSNKKDVSQFPMEESSFIDENYFKNFVPVTEKSSTAQEFPGDMFINPEQNFDCRKNVVAEQNSSEKLHTKLESDITEDQQIATGSSHKSPEYATYNESVMDFASNLKNKRENFKFSGINHHEDTANKNYEQKLKQILPDEFENLDFLRADSVSKQKRQKLVGNVASGTQSVRADISEKKLEQSSNEEVDSISTAHDFVTKLRKEKEIHQQTVKKEKSSDDDEKVDSKGFRILKNQVDDLAYFTRDEIFNMLKQNVVYSDDDLLILNKPYGLVMHESQTTNNPCLSSFLNDLAKDLDQKSTDPKLLTVHRLDKETTGCLLLARNETMAQYLKALFAQRQIIKKYWIVTVRVPDPCEGIIDIPISEGSVNNKKRMVLHPKLPKDTHYKSHSRHGREAITSYSVISESGNAALVEAIPKTGLKHQIRVHFGFGLSCPILGDHKYSHLDKLVPQKLPADILQKLKVRQSKVRYIPMHIHAKSVTIPRYFEDRDLFVNIPLPRHMITNLKRLKFRKK